MADKTLARHPWTRATLVGVSVALLTASSMSFLDWRLNPGGLFRGEDGTSWLVVWNTWASWFVPVFLLAGGFVLPVLLWRSRRQ